MKKRKHSVSEFFYDNSFSDYVPIKPKSKKKFIDTYIVQEYKFFKRYFNYVFFIKFKLGYNFILWLISSPEKYKLSGILFANSLAIAFALLGYFEIRKTHRHRQI